ncbi:MAG TPA: hypothetical protein VGP72_26490 [Planctomycetota bacterium]|jgi:hypothetical protein
MIAKIGAVLVLATMLSTVALAGEGVSVGSAAPALEGKTWITSDGKAPELQGKVYLVHFWFAG